MSRVEKLFITLANFFPVWVVGGACLALWNPSTATWFQPTWIPHFLGIIMLSMGLTLSLEDFLRVIQIPRSIALAVGLQYTIMPLLGFSLAKIFHLPIDYLIGIVLVACCPGGTASNVVCFIARTNIALSVSLTAVSTLIAVLITPLLTTIMIEFISRNSIEGPIQVDTTGLLVNTFKVVILPVTAGALLNHFFRKWVKKINSYTPFIAVISIVFIVDFILAAKKEEIISTGPTLVIVIVTLHALGFILGYLLSKWLNFSKKNSQTISIEVGMQNSGLATELARNNFPDFSLATVPGAISALTHCILGSIVAGLCRLQESCNK
ncbi:MAG: bile acid:sodium symporter family protein [Nitrospina sp.]|nr:bile acid:sodium symporter family protein [Nitrospina sp.]MBT6600452.1 bile acid:sodium symporter family protein [Nitrospina sp.]